MSDDLKRLSYYQFEIPLAVEADSKNIQGLHEPKDEEYSNEDSKRDSWRFFGAQEPEKEKIKHHSMPSNADIYQKDDTIENNQKRHKLSFSIADVSRDSTVKAHIINNSITHPHTRQNQQNTRSSFVELTEDQMTMLL